MGENQTSERRTVEFFKKKFGKEISLEEARQINERLSITFRLLARWDRNQQSSKSGDTDLKTG